MTKARDDKNERMREASGMVEDDSRLVEFLYLLMRDSTVIGTVENLVSEVETTPCGGSLFTNGWLANYAKYLAARLQPNGDRIEGDPTEAVEPK